MKTRELIAVIDDEESVRRALKRLLTAAGFQAQTFASGTEFLNSLAAGEPACIILDLHMPSMSGFEVQQRLRDGQSRIPVVVITGHDTPESQQRSAAQGAVCYLRKPVDDDVLLGAISEAVSRSKTPE